MPPGSVNASREQERVPRFLGNWTADAWSEPSTGGVRKCTSMCGSAHGDESQQGGVGLHVRRPSVWATVCSLQQISRESTIRRRDGGTDHSSARGDQNPEGELNAPRGYRGPIRPGAPRPEARGTNRGHGLGSPGGSSVSVRQNRRTLRSFCRIRAVCVGREDRLKTYARNWIPWAHSILSHRFCPGVTLGTRVALLSGQRWFITNNPC